MGSVSKWLQHVRNFFLSLYRLWKIAELPEDERWWIMVQLRATEPELRARFAVRCYFCKRDVPIGGLCVWGELLACEICIGMKMVERRDEYLRMVRTMGAN